MATSPSIVIVGAGVAGLACARELRRRERGLAIRVLEKSRGVGGRSATRRCEGQPVDHGPAFYHGNDPGFLAALEEPEPASRLDGWPRRVHGSGRPCEPRAFVAGERRLAFKEGMTVFPKRLARDVEVRLRAEVVGLRLSGGTIRTECEDGTSLDARDVVLAVPAPQCAALLDPLSEASPDLVAMGYLLRAAANVRCLTTVAGYRLDVAVPGWDLTHPEDSSILQTISHDSTKRETPAWTVLVLQAHAAWSLESWNRPTPAWSGDMLSEAARLLGAWAARPAWTSTHRWRYARARGSGELSGPALVHLGRGTRIGLAGEIFSPGGGVQAAWRSGVELGRRIIEERRG